MLILLKNIKFKTFLILIVLFLSFVPKASANDITNINYEFTANNYDELMGKIKEFTFFHLDNNDPDFSIVITGQTLNNYTYKGLLNTNMDFEAPIIEEYMKTKGKDYNALSLRQYTVNKTVWNDGVNLEKPLKLKLLFEIVWADNKAQLQKINQFAKETVKKIIGEEDDSYTKLLALHRFVVDNFQYDTNKNEPIHDTYEFIINKKGVCSAYAGLMYKLLIEAGFNARIILNEASATDQNGGSSSHAWNLVLINGKYYHIDATWDDPVTPFNINSPNLKYFLKGDAFMENDHSWNREIYEMASEDFNYNSYLNIDIQVFNENSTVSSNSKNVLANETQNATNNGEKSKTNNLSNINFLVYLVGVGAFLYLFIAISLLYKKNHKK